jgi:hypothetical protein
VGFYSIFTTQLGSADGGVLLHVACVTSTVLRILSLGKTDGMTCGRSRQHEPSRPNEFHYLHVYL